MSWRQCVTVNGTKSLYGPMSRVVFHMHAKISLGPCYIFNVAIATYQWFAKYLTKSLSTS